MKDHKGTTYHIRMFQSYSASLIFLVLVFTNKLVIQTQALNAPTITEHPPAEVAYRLENDVKIPCNANPDSKSEYSWKKNDEILDISGRRVALEHNSGNLIIRKTTEADEGEYQCFASNKMGTAVSTRANLKKAYFVPFPSSSDAVIERPKVGEPLSLSCSPPQSYPRDTPYWGISRKGDKRHQSLLSDARVQVDYNGGLHFANIRAEDSLGDKEVYLCFIHNKELRASANGNDVKVVPEITTGVPQNRRPQLVWSSDQLDKAVKGQNKKIKCIFSGFPTPQVTWSRVGKSMNMRMEPTVEGYGTELEIKNVDEADEGEYECSAVNSVSSPAKHKIKLVVESKPFWNQGRPPADVQVEEEGSASFICQAHGSPKPEVSWGINGRNLKDLPYDSRRTLSGDTLSFSNLSASDTQVIQCVANNTHGTILANAYLIVISAHPSFTKTPNDTKIVEGKTARFPCHAYGAPRPVITWQRGSPPYPVQTGFGSRYKVHDNGDLEIENAVLSDEDDYICVAQNKHETIKVKAKLDVRRATKIHISDPVVKANRSDDVYLQCNVVTDPKEYDNLKVEWRKDGKAVDYNVDRHLEMNIETHALTIKRSMVKDTAKYTCHADNGLDKADSNSTQLTVMDRPEPPTDLKVLSCTVQYAQVSFLPGYDNNDQITSFTVYYSIGDEPEFIRGAVINRTINQSLENQRIHAKVPVQPWKTYKFYVTATNGIGTSEISSRSSDKCNTPQSAPDMNPKNVCSKLKGSGQLVITWDPIPPDQHYGEGFRYVVGYKRLNTRDQERVIKIPDPKQNELAIHDLPIFTQYEICVWAENNIGQTPYVSRERKIGYSSEGKPLVAPKNFRLNGDKFNGSYGEFIWDPVDTSLDKIRGFFRGYRIKFWKTNDPNNVRTEDVIVNSNEIELCPPLDELPPKRRRRQAGSGSVYGTTHKLWPYSKITAGVTVLNSAHDGNLSNTIEFETQEGPPEAVKDLMVTDIGSSHLTVAWSLPASSNGVLLSFILEYQVAPPLVGALRKEIIDDTSIMTRKILNLQSDTMYRISLYAVTIGGPGQSIYVDEATLTDSEPDKPRISKVEAGIDSANVSFDATERPPKKNPGSHFYVEYAKEGIGNQWEKTNLDPHSPENWVQVENLEPGVYFFRVVAVNGRDGHNRETRSDAMRIVIGERRDYEPPRPKPEGLVQHAGASAGWFIALMCIIVLLLIILLIICCIKRSKGDMYPVYEKEKMLGRDPFAPDDAPFGEYNSSGRPDRSRSQGSLDSDEKPMESDTDSLGEYEDQDASKFNEDGSFIGLYGGKGRPRLEPTAPSMNTFV